MDRIEEDKSDVEDCMLQLVEDWVCNKDGTGELPRTWQTVVQVVKEMKVPMPEQLEEQYGHLTWVKYMYVYILNSMHTVYVYIIFVLIRYIVHVI